MAKFTKKPVTVEAITFQELVDHGRRVAPESINGGMPWSFTYAGHHISHENDTCYLIPTLEGTMKMGPGDMLITGVKGEIYPCKRDIFEATYETALPVIDPGPDSLEREIQAKADKAPRVTPSNIEAEIASVHFFVASDAIQHENAVHEHGEAGWLLGATQQLTFCVIQLRNGFTVTGESACASPENFNAEIGRRIARENAINKVWPLLGFRLRDELARPVLTDADAAADLAGTPRPTV